jgi:ribosomal protein S18 acetylase RimI-like enzyme
VRVRDAVPEDAEAIATAHVRAWQDGYAHVFSAERLASLSISARTVTWRSRLASGLAVLVVEEAGDVVGFATVGPSRDEDGGGTGELYGIYVRPDAWGRGAGQALMACAHADLRRRGFDEATLWVLADNPRARRFYERAGWTPDGTVKDDEFLDTPVQEVRYRVRL